MKKILLLASMLWSISLAAAPVQFTGRVTEEGKGIEGVKVTDGFNITVTDAKGKYALNSDGKAEFVYITVPSGYQVPLLNNAPEFYRNVSELPGSKAKVDFELTPTGVDMDKHLFIVWADAQVYEDKEVDYIRQAAADVAETVASYGLPAHGISCGDIIGDYSRKPSLFLPVTEATASSGIPFHCLMGNHDYDMDVRTNEASKKLYTNLFGPTYYSYDVGSIHYVVLDDVFYLGRNYVGYLEESQLLWLEKDLSFVPKGSTVVVSVHIPTYSRQARHEQWSKEEYNKIVCNRQALYNILEPYNAHIMAAHEHYAENYMMSNHLFEHVHAPLSGLFWQSLWSCDGVPWGYSVYEIDGSDIRWHYKAIGKSAEEQFTVYPVGSDPMHPGDVVVNVWNYDRTWKVEWSENGIPQGSMTRFKGWDNTIVADVEARREKEFKWKYIGAGDTEHLFRATPSTPDARITLSITDHFGKIWIVEL